jgi:hypothetical protein
MFNFGDVDFFLDSLWINFAIKKNEFATRDPRIVQSF